ncbi:MAG: rRNA pseudouridine synthase [Candidatus Yonathbacteria bacterium]|nr:rRNA pseudouridine synthase [Candidatus Yonathbacteria bacterium]
MNPIDYPLRINKYLRDKGFASRREADELISTGKVTINGVVAKAGILVRESDTVVLNQPHKKTYIYLAYYKPRGLPTQGLKGDRSVITDWQKKDIFPVGRLDKMSEGLLILTNDGRVTTKILGTDTRFEKEYLVTVRENLRAGVVAIFKKGMNTDALGKLLPADAVIIDPTTIKIILREGKHHQIRVMLRDLGYTITSLKRVRIGHISLSNLKPGETRPLGKAEADELFA